MRSAEGSLLPLQTFFENDFAVDGHLVVEKDIPATNGVVHVINDVLQPKDLDKELRELQRDLHGRRL